MAASTGTRANSEENDVGSSSSWQMFVRLWRTIENQVHDSAKSKGFWPEGRTRADGELIALMHSELSEALEALRNGDPASEHIPEFSGAEEEMADLVIRVMDTACNRGWRIPEAIIAKIKFNAERKHKHGKKF